MRGTFFTRLLLFLIACCGWALTFFGGWIAWRGVFFYARDPVLMGTGGGLAIGGLLVVAMTLAAQVQVRTAQTTAAILDRLETLSRRGADQSAPAPDARQEPRLAGQLRKPDV